jgi:RHS repeat-associated protein
VVKTTDGTQLKFIPVTLNNEFRCVEIKDRNGNYISATYNTTNGHLLTITDTLDRVVSYVYDGNSNLQAIRQTWGGAAHDWATFEYGETWVAPNFGGGLSVNGPNNNNVTVLTKVKLHDNSFYSFEYNPGFGQVKKIRHFAPDAHELSYTSYNVDSSAGQLDCPRFTERRDWGQYGVMGISQEVVTTYSVASDGSWSKQTAPDGTIYKEFFGTTGWQTGLTISTKNYANATDEVSDSWKKRTTTSWMQDDPNLTYPKNPRPIETNIHDSDGNRRRTTIDYLQGYSLPTHIREYAGADGLTFLRLNAVVYNLEAVYLNRRIIGLPYEQLVYDGPTGNLVSRKIFHYDWGAPYLSPQAPGTHYDSVNYPSSFIVGRGNLVQVRRYDCQDGTTAYNESLAVPVQTNHYNMAGSNVWSEDANGHRAVISFADSFSDGNITRNTLAYPTAATDPDNFSSTAQYNYDFGAVTRTEDPKGAVQTMTYDGAARLLRITNEINAAYTRWVYPASMGYVEQLSTIKAGAGEASSANVLDGWGRVRASSRENPASMGGYSGQFFRYDEMGNLVNQTNPTEMNGSWVPSGDDAAGWVWNPQTYDWKGRPLLTTNPDGSTRENTYGGCGCAGGEVTTVRDEPGRRRRMTMDALGRLKQVEELRYDQSVYATTTYTYNARDQITNINQAGQMRTFGYDGHGRLQSRTTPEQGTTTYSYYQDDTPTGVTDARGAKTTFTYNARHLPTGIAYDLSNVIPGQNVAATPNVSFGYDGAGNRTSMSDGLGSVSYVYNTLSQLTSETRTFTGLGSFTLSYPSYDLGGQLTNITNHWGAQVGYNYDKTGRPIGMTGAGYAGVTSYVNSITYRAFAAKQMAYNNGRTLSLQYDNRMRMTRWDVPGVMGWDYDYNSLGENTGRVTYSHNRYDQTLDRSYEYNSRGRLVVAHSGTEARAHVGLPGGQWGIMDGPFSLGYEHDVWGNLTHQYGWGGETQGGTAGQTSDIYRTYENNRIVGPSYDAAGNYKADGSVTYDATGQQISFPGGGMTHSYDGDRLRLKKVENGVATYYLRSSVLGGKVVAEINGAGTWMRGYVYLGGQMVGIQSNNSVTWVHQDPVNKSQRLTNSAGTVTSTIELDPWGANTNRSINSASQTHRFTSYEHDSDGGEDAMMRRYASSLSRFSQPDPYDGSYDLTEPQSFNRYAYVQNDPVNFVDPSGLDGIISFTPFTDAEMCYLFGVGCGGSGGSGGAGNGFVIEHPFPDGPSTGGGEIAPQNPGPDKTVPEPQGKYQTPIWCQPDVIEAMKRAWQATGNGIRGNEAGFVLNGSPSKYQIVDTKSGNTQGYDSMIINLPGNPSGATFALFHVHPNNGGQYPSTPGNNKLGNKEGDTGVADRLHIQYYVMSKSGLAMYDPMMKNDPKTKGMTMLRQNLDWTKACK